MTSKYFWMGKAVLTFLCKWNDEEKNLNLGGIHFKLTS